MRRNRRLSIIEGMGKRRTRSRSSRLIRRRRPTIFAWTGACRCEIGALGAGLSFQLT